MTDTHVVSALKEKRTQVASQIESLQAQLRQSAIDLDHVEAALKLFDPEVDLALPARKIAPVSYDTKPKRDADRVSAATPKILVIDVVRLAKKPVLTRLGSRKPLASHGRPY